MFEGLTICATESSGAPIICHEGFCNVSPSVSPELLASRLTNSLTSVVKLLPTLQLGGVFSPVLSYSQLPSSSVASEL